MTTAQAFFLDSPGTPLTMRELELGEPQAGEALVEVEACGMCHTDLGYQNGSVKPNHELPLVLGHEIVGKVVAQGGNGALVGKRVIVPAVLPCGDCPFCAAGRGNACLKQKMPGNDVHGGFASHVLVPAAPLVDVSSAPETLDTRCLGVVADAVSTAYQAVLRAELSAGDVAFVIGSGGVGGYCIQLAHALGAKVVACDISDGRLEPMAAHGADELCNVSGMSPRDVRKKLHGLARGWEIPSLRYRIFECSGSPQGQELAYTLLARAATLMFVGYTFDKVTVRLSNLMAFDATAHGTWGCPPAAYGDVLQFIYDGRVRVEPFVDYAPLSSVNDQLAAMAAHKLEQRMVLDPALS
jgi:6-hydroxycyclohex-1-ene-1-carbonyl-CoA dehydrogenase